eukprot:1603730-Amphidinium_carterae.1
MPLRTRPTPYWHVERGRLCSISLVYVPSASVPIKELRTKERIALLGVAQKELRTKERTCNPGTSQKQS